MRPRPDRLPPLARALLGAALHGAEREEVLNDMAEEFAGRAQRAGPLAARLWLWRQVANSLPSMVTRGWFRGTTGFESEAHRMKGGALALESWIMDARFALRSLRARPLYLALAVLTLGLGIGGTTAVYGIARAVLLNPLPYAASHELVAFWNTYDWSEAEMAYLRPEWPGFSGVAAYRPEDVFLRREGSPPRMVPGIAASAELFDMLGVRPRLGRGFEPGADAVGAEPTAVLSHALWQELGGDPGIVGTVVQLDGDPRKVTGVMPPGFWFPDPSVRVWLSQPMRPDNRSGNYALVGRQAPGATEGAMTDALRRLTTRLREQFTYPSQWDKTRNAQLTPLRDYLLGPVRPALLATLAGMGVILLIACANVAALMLGQLRGRASELALRVALGAGGRRLAQQLLVEAVLLGLFAGVVGAVAAKLGFALLVSALPLGALSHAVTADWTLFGSALLIALAAAILVATAPVLSLWRGDLRAALSHARSGGMDAHGGRLENALVVGEVSLALLLATGAAVLIRSVEKLHAVETGIRAEGVAVVDVSASGEVARAQRWPQVEALLQSLRPLPGVSHVAATQRLPLRGGGDNWGIAVEGKPELPSSTTAVRLVTREYFALLGIPLRSGRLFDETDRPGSEPAVVIDEVLARKYFPGEDPVGRRISYGLAEGWARIVGVVGGVAHEGLKEEPGPGRYLLIEQSGYVPPSLSLLLRVEGGDAAGILRQAQETIRASSSTIAVQEATTFERLVALAMGPTRRVMQLMTLIGALALVLGAVGVYGVVSHFVNRRRREWVIKMALGMRPRDALQQVVGRGVVLVGAGCVIGLVASVALTRFFASLLYGVSAADPLALAAASATLLVAGCLAALVPAVRASRANPAAVLREVE